MRVLFGDQDEFLHRQNKNQVGQDRLGEWLDYKINLVELLHKEKGQVRKSKIYFGNATDIYMPVARRLRLVPLILEFFLEHPPLELEVQTRDTARDVARDIPLLQELAEKTSVLVSYSIHTDRDDVKKIFEPKAPSPRGRIEGLKLYHAAGIETRLSCMPILPLDPENFAEQLAPFTTKRVWIAAMNHKELTLHLFRKHFPEWLDERHIERVMQQTKEAFERRGAPTFYHSLDPQSKRERWAKREAKITERKNNINRKTVERLVEKNISQPSLFD